MLWGVLGRRTRHSAAATRKQTEVACTNLPRFTGSCHYNIFSTRNVATPAAKRGVLGPPSLAAARQVRAPRPEQVVLQVALPRRARARLLLVEGAPRRVGRPAARREDRLRVHVHWPLYRLAAAWTWVREAFDDGWVGVPREDPRVRPWRIARFFIHPSIHPPILSLIHI